MMKRARSETPEFLEELQQHISLPVWDELSEGFYSYIEDNLDVFPKLADSQLRVAQTETFFRDEDNIPNLEIWFRMSADDEKLILLGVTNRKSVV